jgi:hypothetical protein
MQSPGKESVGVSGVDAFNRKLQVQRANVLRDSLEQAPPAKTAEIITTIERSPPTKATVENEEGEILEVVYDPVIKCYYDPKTNSYYDLKDC